MTNVNGKPSASKARIDKWKVDKESEGVAFPAFKAAVQHTHAEIGRKRPHQSVSST